MLIDSIWHLNQHEKINQNKLSLSNKTNVYCGKNLDTYPKHRCPVINRNSRQVYNMDKSYNCLTNTINLHATKIETMLGLQLGSFINSVHRYL